MAALAVAAIAAASPAWGATAAVVDVEDCEKFARSASAMPIGAPELGPVPADHPPLLEQCQGKIRPGAPVTSGFSAYCTFSFIFTDAQGNLYTGTAAHCVSRNERVATSAVGTFGTVVMDGALGVDYALVKIDSDKHGFVDPTLCQWGGPTGVGQTDSILPRDVLYEYGWGFMTSSNLVTRARPLVEVSSSGNTLTWAQMGSGGDSGAPIVNAAGEAVGSHTFGVTPAFGVIGEGGPTIQAMIAAARTVVPSITLVEGDPSNLEQLGAAHLYD